MKKQAYCIVLSLYHEEAKCFFKWAKPGLFFVFRSFHNSKTTIAQCEYVTINDKSIDGLLGTQTRCSKM